MIVFKKSKYYTRGTPEYNKRFARQITGRRAKKIIFKITKLILILLIISIFIKWVIIVIKPHI